MARAGPGVLRKQAENSVEDTTDRTAEREREYSGDEDSGGSEDVAEQAQAGGGPLGHRDSCKARMGGHGSAKCGAKRMRAKRASRHASGRWVVVNPCATRGMDGAQRGLARRCNHESES